MTGWQARLDASRRVVRCHNCGVVLGRIWENGTGERHLLFPNTMDLSRAGVWSERPRARRAKHFDRPPYRRPLPVAGSLTPGRNPFAAIALEPTVYPLRVRCPWCKEVQGIDAAAITVVVPEPGDPPEPFKTWPLVEPFEGIGRPEEE